MNWYLAVLKQYATFTGRARRKEYWLFALVSLLIYTVLVFIDAVTGTFNGSIGALSGLYSLGTLIPAFAVTIRRLHDTNHSGWTYLLILIPLVGAIVLLIFLVRDSQPESNVYGPNPKAAT